MSKNALKAIIKECLIEILSEGLGDVSALAARSPAPGRFPNSGVVESRIRGAQVQGQRQKAGFDPRLDTPMSGNRIPSAALKQAVKEGSNGNPILAEMLADTAMTTLPEQLSHGDRPGAPSEGTGGPVSRNSAPIQQEQFSGNPDEIFGGGSGRWADLAFQEPTKKLA